MGVVCEASLNGAVLVGNVICQSNEASAERRQDPGEERYKIYFKGPTRCITSLSPV